MLSFFVVHFCRWPVMGFYMHRNDSVNTRQMVTKRHLLRINDKTGKVWKIMNQAYKTLEFNRILEMLKERALTENAKMRLEELEPLMSENELMHRKMETTQARKILEQMGNPPLVSMKDMETYLRIDRKSVV